MDQKYRVGDGIVPRESNRAKWEAWARATPAQTIVLFDTSRNGEYADRLRRAGLRVVGSGSICDRMEGDRRWALRMARLLGIKTPAGEEFSTVSDAQRFLKNRRSDAKWYFKTNRDLGCSMTLGEKPLRLVPHLNYVREAYGDRIAHVLQREVEGTAISTGAWWNGTTFLSPYEGTIEHKKFMNDEKGPSTGCAFNVLWFYSEELPEIAKRLQFPALAEFLRRESAPPGIYDINAVVAKDGEPYFLEFTPRMGYDSEPTAQALIDPAQGELGTFLEGLASGTLRECPFVRDEAALSVRVSVAPAPVEGNDLPWKADPVLLGVDGLWDGNFVAYNVCKKGPEYRICDPMGIAGLGLACGTNLHEMNDEVLDYLDDLWAPNLQYRTDASDVLAKDVEEIRSAGYAAAEMLEV